MTTRPDVLLRTEALVVLCASLAAYSALLGGSWWLFAALILAPDLSLLGYAIPNQKALAAAIYNAVHSYVLPLLLALLAWRRRSHLDADLATIWIAHIAFDRLLGFGLKYRNAFKPTHIQRAGVFG